MCENQVLLDTKLNFMRRKIEIKAANGPDGEKRLQQVDNARYTLNPYGGIDDENRTTNTDEYLSKFPALYSSNTVMAMNTKIYVGSFKLRAITSRANGVNKPDKISSGPGIRCAVPSAKFNGLIIQRDLLSLIIFLLFHPNPQTKQIHFSFPPVNNIS